MICLSFDTDRMDEGRMREFLASVELPGRVTLFCTQVYDCLVETEHELGPHPYLPAAADWESELQRTRRQFPDAVGWRSHSCVFSHMLAEQVAALGYRYVSIRDDLGARDPAPIRHAYGVWDMPIYYMDSLDFSASRFWADVTAEPFDREIIDTAVEGDGLYVFDFHPIHLVLNSPDAGEYFTRRERLQSGEPLSAIRYEGRGTLTFYNELIEAMAAREVTSVALGDALAQLSPAQL